MSLSIWPTISFKPIQGGVALSSCWIILTVLALLFLGVKFPKCSEVVSSFATALTGTGAIIGMLNGASQLHLRNSLKTLVEAARKTPGNWDTRLVTVGYPAQSN